MIILSSSLPLTVFARPLFSDSNILSRTARLALPGRNRFSSWMRWRIGDALFSPHFYKSPECCTCQTYSPFDIFLTPSILRYQSSQIDKSCDLFQHPCSQSHLQFLMLFSYCHRFCFFCIYLYSPILLLLLLTLFVRSCRLSFTSAIRSMSSAKRRFSSSLPLSFTPVPLPSFSANLITISSIRLNKSGDSPQTAHPCLTPTLTSKDTRNFIPRMLYEKIYCK